MGLPFGRAIRYYSSTLLPLRFTNISGVTATIPNPIPFVTGDRNKKIYASTMLNGDSDIEDLNENTEKISTVSGVDIRAVLYALTDVILNMLADGKSVKLGKW